MGSLENYSGSVGKIIVIVFLSFRVSTPKIKNIDHRVKGTCATDSTQVTYETDNIYLLRDSTMSSALNFFFVFYFNLKKKDHIRRNINNKRMFICGISFIIILICQKSRSVGPVQQKIKLPLPYKGNSLG